MKDSLGTRIKNAWNVFRNPTVFTNSSSGGSYYRQDRPRLRGHNERTIINSVMTKIAIDVSTIDIMHCKLDDKDRFKDVIPGELNDRLSLEANLDQSSRAFIRDVVLSMLDDGCVAIVPVDTSCNPDDTESYKIHSMRAGKIIGWYPTKVLVSLYNDQIGYRQDIIVPKKNVAIIENPLFPVMNETNSTLQRLTRKLSLLDIIDEQSGSGRLDLIIQLPYTVKSQARKNQANERRAEIEQQLRGTKYGIAYTDGTEKITQLNRPVENNLMKQIEYLTSMLYSQLGISESVLDGTADEKTMNNYYTRTIEPIITTIVDEMNRKFLSKTARTQKQKILFFRDPFKLVPVSQVAEIADKFTRNEILSSNEIRQVIGRKPSDDPKADQLINSNISQAKGNIPSGQNTTEEKPKEGNESVPTESNKIKRSVKTEDTKYGKLPILESHT